jgi:PilZ domain
MALNDQEFRKEKRVPFTTKASLATTSEGGQVVKDASTIDLSESGARVRFSGNIQPGQAVELFFTTRPEPCLVVWTAPGKAPEELIVGLQFTSPVPEQHQQQKSAAR